MVAEVSTVTVTVGCSRPSVNHRLGSTPTHLNPELIDKWLDRARAKAVQDTAT